MASDTSDIRFDECITTIECLLAVLEARTMAHLKDGYTDGLIQRELNDLQQCPPTVSKDQAMKRLGRLTPLLVKSVEAGLIAYSDRPDLRTVVNAVMDKELEVMNRAEDSESEVRRASYPLFDTCNGHHPTVLRMQRSLSHDLCMSSGHCPTIFA